MKALEGHRVSSKSPPRVPEIKISELLGGAEENSVSRTRAHNFARQINDLLIFLSPLNICLLAPSLQENL